MKFTNAAILFSAVALIASDEPKKDDAEALKGNWSAVSMKVGGKSAPDDLIQKFKVNFDGKGYTNTVDGDVIEVGGYTVDSSRTPKTIDFEIKKGQGEGKKQLGIFQIEGNKLTLVVADPGAPDRPKSLKPEDADTVAQVVLERAKP